MISNGLKQSHSHTVIQSKCVVYVANVTPDECLVALSHLIVLSHFIPDAYCTTLHMENTISTITNVNAIMHGKHNFPLQEMASLSWSTWKTHKVAQSNHPSQNPV